MDTPDQKQLDNTDSETRDPVARLEAALGMEISADSDGKNSMRMEGTSLAVAQALALGAGRGEYLRGARQAFAEMAAVIPTHLQKVEEIRLSGLEAAQLLEGVIPRLAKRGQEIFSRALPAWDWTWMIRRLPLTHVWDSQSALSVRAYMSALALAGNRIEAAIPPGGVLNISPRHADRLTFLAGYTSVLAPLTMAYRMVGKGGVVTLARKGGRISTRLDDPVLRGWLREYDQRVADVGAWGGFGVHIPEIHNEALGESSASSGSLGLVFARGQPQWDENAPATRPRLERYRERFVELDDVFAVLADEDAPNALQLDAELAPLLCLAATFALARKEGVLEREMVALVGYTLHLVRERDMGSTRLGECMGRAIAWATPRLPNGAVPESPNALWERLRAMPSVLWPLRPGPITMTVAKDALVIDWSAASSRLLHALRYPRVTGDTANLRGRAFETSMRTAIGSTRFAPEPWLAELQGRHLQLGDRKPFGEIDAAVSLPGYNTHLVISCKSYPYSESYERGDHREVRNISERLGKDANEVVELCVTLMRNKVGRNYTIPDGGHLLPVLVTPRVMWSSDPLCWERIMAGRDGPPLACGATELLKFLERIPDRE